jgi:Uma2 family endonuclease
MATAHPQGQRMTAALFDAAFGGVRDDRGDRELVDGVVVEGEMPNRRHQIVLLRLQQLLDPWATAKGGGTWADAELRLNAHNVRQPDLIAWWSQQTVPLDGQMTDTPELVVEIMSARPRDVRRDADEKRAQYCAFGVPHYWIIEPLHHQFEALLRKHGRLGDGTVGWYYDRMQFAVRGTITPLVGPVLDLDALFRDL